MATRHKAIVMSGSVGGGGGGGGGGETEKSNKKPVSTPDSTSV